MVDAGRRVVCPMATATSEIRLMDQCMGSGHFVVFALLIVL